MHRFLTAFLVLSTLAMTQNVVAGTPSLLPERSEQSIVGLAQAGMGGASDLQVASMVGGQIPTAGTMLLLVTGLAGLSAVGERSRVRRTPARPVSRESHPGAQRGILA